MRDKLAVLEEKRRTFTGTFERIGYKDRYRNRAPSMTVLFKDVRNKKGELVTDHLWFNYTKGFQELDLNKGDRVKFKARVKEYEKGTRGTTDYRLSHPTQIEKLLKPRPVIIKKR